MRGSMSTVLRANLREHARRYVATGLAVAIGVAFVVVCLVLSAGLSDSLTRSVRQNYQGAAAVVSISDDADWEHLPDLASLEPTVGAADGVTQVGVSASSGFEASAGGHRAYVYSTILNDAPLPARPMVQGTAPEGAGQVAMDVDTARQLGLTVGDTLQLESLSAARTDAAASGDAEPSSSDTTAVTVTGLIASSANDGATVAMTQDAARALDPVYAPSQLLVAGGDRTPSAADQQALVGRITAALSDAGVQTDELSVRTHDDAVAADLAMMKMGQGTMTAVVLVFPAIAAVVAGIVVSTTFQVILQQRRRELALLRTLGASARQVRSLMRRETAVIGAAASLAGVLVGALVGVAGVRAAGLAPTVGQAVGALKPLTLVLVWALGALVTVLIGIRPVRSVTRISPIEALSPIDEGGAAARRSHRVRLAAGLVLTALGVAGMLGGISMPKDSGTGFVVALGCGLIGLIGALLVCSVALPAVAQGVGAALRGPVGAMARANTQRNRDRTGSTGTAIVIGVTLIVMMMVAAGSMRQTLLTEVDERRPLDLVAATADGAPLPSGTIDQIRAVPGVSATADLSSVGGAVGSPSSPIASDWDGSPEITIIGEPDLNTVTHSAVSTVGDGQVGIRDGFFLGNDDSDGGAVAPGDTLTVCTAPGTCRELTAVTDTSLGFGQISVSAATLEAMAPGAPVSMVAIKLSDDADAQTVMSSLLSLDDSLTVSGGAQERAMYTQAIDTVLLVVVALLAVSVLVALVGVANTLSLSVHERTRENGLLRALGLTRRQMQRLLAAEAIDIALPGALIGIGLGILFGWAGVNAMPVEVDRTFLIVPWWQILAVAIIAVLCAVVAAWWPGRRAARTSPVEALAHE